MAFGQESRYGGAYEEREGGKEEDGVTPPWVWYALAGLAIFFLIKTKVEQANEQQQSTPSAPSGDASSPSLIPIPKIKKIITV